ncbi:MAG: aminomethyl transferase family protein [Planctomycetes bacterium]|nr:aminomethyl transferase family protein [Planctomycetota bacterium]
MKSSILSPLHAERGAHLAADGTVLFFRDVPDEYRSALEGAALVDLTDRGAVEVRGPEAAVFLHRLLANDARNLAAGQGNSNLLLDAKGKVRFQFELVRLADDVLELSTEPGEAQPVVKALDMYHFAEKLTFADVTERHAPLALAGPRAFEFAGRALGAAVELAPGERTVRAWRDGEVAITRLPYAGSDGLRLDAGPRAAQALWLALAEAGAQPIGRVVDDILRVEACAARAHVDVDETIYPQEARLERAFSLDKGCYIGQEVVAKIDTYGGLNKRMVALRVSNDDPVPRGTRLFRLDDGEWRDLGVVTSWAYSFVLDTGLVLAYVKRRHQKVGTEFRLGEGPHTATVVASPVRAHALAPTGENE